MFNGMNCLEILKNWPRFEDGEPVSIGDEVVDEAEEIVYRVSEIAFSDGYGTCLRYEDQRDGNSYNFIDGLEPGEHVKRPAPKVLDADGVEIRVGDTVCGTRDMEPMRVVDTDSRECGFKHIKCEKEGEGFFFYCADELTHKLPVLAADGRPLRVGETVWDEDSGDRLIVGAIEDGGHTITCRYADLGDSAIPTHGSWSPCNLTHERPESWERIEEDAGKNPFDYCKDVGHRLDTCENSEAYKARDLVRRCKAMAERERRGA